MTNAQENHGELYKRKIDYILQKHGYKLIDKLGEGGFASCWKVERIDVMQTFAVKIIEMKSPTESGVGYNAYYSEIDTIIHLTHPNIIRCYHYFREENLLFLILDFCPGGSLEDVITSKRLLHTNQMYEYVYSLLQALEYMHNQKIAHLDIKPSNILIDAYGRVKFADFGLAQYVLGNRTNKYSGSLAFMAPEIHSQKPYDPFKADVWSFGVTLYYLAFRQLPWLANNKYEYEQMVKIAAFQIPMNADPALKKIILRSIVVNPENRATISELLSIFKNSVEERLCLNRSVKIQKSQIHYNLKQSSLCQPKPRARLQSNITRPLPVAKSQIVLPVLRQASN